MQKAWALKWLLTVAGLMTVSGCDSGCYDCTVDAEVAVVIEEQGPVYHHGVEVHVNDVYGYSLGGASVELTVAGVPEQRFAAITDPDGCARFYFEAPAGVAVLAYVCAPAYECDASDIGTVEGGGNLQIMVSLHP